MATQRNATRRVHRVTAKRWIAQFPVSIAIEGADGYKRMRDCGFDSVIICATIYAPYRLVLPRYPRKGIYSLEEGKYWFDVDRGAFRDMPVQPTMSDDFRGRDLLGEAVRGARKAGLKPAVWLTVFANGLIAKSHPDWAVHNLYGSADRLFLCYDHPQVREYNLRLVDQIASRYDIAELMLDKVPQTSLEQDTFAGRIDPVLRVMGSFDFSPASVARAKRAGVDLEGIRRKALKLAERSLRIPPHVVNAQRAELTGDMEAPGLLLDHPWLMDLLKLRYDSIRDFLAQTRARLDQQRKNVVLSMAFVPPVKVGHDATSPRAWSCGQSYAQYRDSAADLIHCVVHWDRDAVEYNTRRAVDAMEDSTVKICTHIKAYGSTRPDELAGLEQAVAAGGAHGVGYFCYDLMTDAMLAAAGKLASA